MNLPMNLVPKTSQQFRSLIGISALALATVLVAGSIALAAVPERAQDAKSVTVQGLCHRMLTPDRGSMTVTAEYREKDLKEAAHKATQTYDKFREKVKKLDLPDLELTTSEYRLEEVKEWENQKMVSKGYRARLGLKISTSGTQKLGEVIALAAREGLQDVGGLQMYVSEEKRLSEQSSCLADAATHARSKAERLAGTLGAKLGEVLAIQEGGGFTPGPRPVPMMAMADAGGMRGKSMEISAPEIDAGSQALDLTVNVSFGLK